MGGLETHPTGNGETKGEGRHSHAAKGLNCNKGPAPDWGLVQVLVSLILWKGCPVVAGWQP